MGDRQYGIDPRLAEYAEEIKKIHGIRNAIVIGGGNIFRGVAGASNGMDRVQGTMGILAQLSTEWLYKVPETRDAYPFTNCIKKRSNC
jgi:uridylate kinase